MLQEEARPWSDVAVWAATHGLATLRLDGPLRYLSDDDDPAVSERLVDLLLAGLVHDPPA